MNDQAFIALKNFAYTTSFFPDNQDGYTYTICGADGSPYLTRTLFPRVGGLRPVLHHIHRADNDRHLHNHPWARAAFRILSGSYIEERLVDGQVITREVKTGEVNELTHDTFHRITELQGDVWTFGILGQRVQDWDLG